MPCFVDITPIKVVMVAWQVAIRYSELNLNNRGILGGREQNVSAGLNWYPMRHIEVLLNYVRAMATPNATASIKQRICMRYVYSLSIK